MITRDSPQCCKSAHLTEREADVLVGLASGGTNVQIAKTLHISPATVAHHVERMMAKCHADSRTELVARAYVAGVIAVRQWPPQASGLLCIDVGRFEW